MSFDQKHMKSRRIISIIPFELEQKHKDDDALTLLI